MKKLVVFTGAGISVESGLATFRATDGLWEGHRVEDVATPQAWKADQARVLEFYNKRRQQCIAASPNAAHHALRTLEDCYQVHIITQNVDDLHERAGSANVLHLHGEVRKAQSSLNPRFVYTIKGDNLAIGDTCELGSQLRPHVVWFGEAVPNLERAAALTRDADIFVVIGTSLQVYPAANLLYETKRGCTVYLIDPNADAMDLSAGVIRIAMRATEGVGVLLKKLTE